MDEFARLYDELDKQCRYYCRHLGHLKGLIENDDWIRVVDGSTSGRVLLLGNSEITNALILFNTRMFDTQTDTVTIHKLASKLPTEKVIEKYHRNRMEEVGIRYELEAYFSARSAFSKAKRALRGNGTLEKLRPLRNHVLAHNIVQEIETESATLNDLVELTEAVNELVDLAGYIVTSTRSAYREFSSSAEKETRMLFAKLPALAAIEQ
ncbi:hypothetical protein M3P21_12395 [Ruegeria sp. 2012CJ41-6]|uniref:HEPN AbiU2-like domain-containing protein n=1 Tax=Ruegeria spongiae TaxID=2942209 RepID=A0ABT0Q378_9RHOB|nr:hypothetical protein [Ruegeria spongiae]MCL6284326.1 hypothetical protein [Ruegeria spongiae]